MKDEFPPEGGRREREGGGGKKRRGKEAEPLENLLLLLNHCNTYMYMYEDKSPFAL